MAPPKRNAFYLYCLDLMDHLRKFEHREFPRGIQDVIGLARTRWNDMTTTQRAPFEAQAKEWKRRMAGPEGDHYRRDTTGKLLANKVSQEDALMNRYKKESNWIRSRFRTCGSVEDAKFYFIKFEIFCQFENEREEKGFVPAEVAMVEFSLKEGVTRHRHYIINHGEIPMGYMSDCKLLAGESHNIPLFYEKSNDDYRSIYIDLYNFINHAGEKSEYPPVYTVGRDLEMTNWLLDWLWQHAALGHEANRIDKVFELESLFIELAQAASFAVSRSETTCQLAKSSWDYEAGTRCSFHEEISNRHCALGGCSRWAYAISETMQPLFKFQMLPGRHLPPKATVNLSCQMVAAPVNARPTNVCDEKESLVGNYFNDLDETDPWYSDDDDDDRISSVSAPQRPPVMPRIDEAAGSSRGPQAVRAQSSPGAQNSLLLGQGRGRGFITAGPR